MGRKNDEIDEIAFLKAREKMKADLADKRYKKNWRSVKIPFTLEEGLSNYTKDQLMNITKYWGIKNVSSLKKAELVNVLQEGITKNINQICRTWDEDRFLLLIKMAENGGFAVTSDEEIEEQISYFHRTGVIYTGTFEGKQVLAVAKDLVEPILSMKNNLQFRAMVKRNTEWIKLTKGLLYYYGTVNSPKAAEMVEEYIKSRVDFNEFFSVIYEANDFDEDIMVDVEGFSHGSATDPKRIKQEKEARSDLPYYPFSKQALLKAGEPYYIERNKYYHGLVSYLVKNYNITKSEADRIVVIAPI